MGDAEPGCLGDDPAEGFGGELVGESFTNKCDRFKEEEEEDKGKSRDREEVENFAEGFVEVALVSSG